MRPPPLRTAPPGHPPFTHESSATSFPLIRSALTDPPDKATSQTTRDEMRHHPLPAQAGRTPESNLKTTLRCRWPPRCGYPSTRLGQEDPAARATGRDVCAARAGTNPAVAVHHPDGVLAPPLDTVAGDTWALRHCVGGIGRYGPLQVGADTVAMHLLGTQNSGTAPSSGYAASSQPNSATT
jgi:hypothetical protein